MSQFNIIEDCSPFYIRFTHPGLTELVEYCKSIMPNLESMKDFNHYRLPEDKAKSVLSRTPISSLMPLQEDRVSFFITTPGKYYRAHKDGLADRFSINYPLIISDDACVTNWYSDTDLKDYPIDNLPTLTSRECVGFDKTKHTPIKTMTAKPGECILFNTEMFHDFDNSKSSNIRVVLTLRIRIPLRSRTYFKDAKKIIFGI